ncbi:uncharacterized protein LOC118827800 isoform X3 [Colossoma macropomum]|uniref:uncharacterized protein LOC118827800 isoform X3 n=1 Tax=Colossoma macropomum TaxID=42526 RepID=UPI00186424D4|nr:uncharacterized protein LOC118827800 isoform X3 [Colossoma macropomum]
MVVALLLCVVGLLSVSGGSQTTLILEAEPGDDVTLQCPCNLTYTSSPIHWFRQINTSAPEFLILIYYPAQIETYSEDVVSKGLVRMTAFVNKSMIVYLMINEVDSADSGLYFCGIQRMHGHITFSSATLLQVKERKETPRSKDDEAEEAEIEEPEEAEGRPFDIFFILTVIFSFATVILLIVLLIFHMARK